MQRDGPSDICSTSIVLYPNFYDIDKVMATFHNLIKFAIKIQFNSIREIPFRTMLKKYSAIIKYRFKIEIIQGIENGWTDELFKKFYKY